MLFVGCVCSACMHSHNAGEFLVTVMGDNQNFLAILQKSGRKFHALTVTPDNFLEIIITAHRKI